MTKIRHDLKKTVALKALVAGVLLVPLSALPARADAGLATGHFMTVN
ncbi:MAG: hypothetical protein ACRD3W_04140 [Terriglobales bacterium]